MTLSLLLLHLLAPASAPSAGLPASGAAAVAAGPAVPARYGLLWLEIEPAGAHIALDGEFLDRGVWLISMAPGLHDLAIRKEGYRAWTRRIGIGPGEKLRIAVNLEADSPD